jgi:hypothetical protein
MHRFDYMVIGYFSCKESSELLKKKNVKHLIEFQKKYPSAVFINYDRSMTQNGLYDLNCYRLNKSLMDLVDLIEIEENEPNILKKFTPSDQLTTRLNFRIKSDIFSMVSKLTDDQEVSDAHTSKERELKLNVDKANIFRRL